MKSIRGIILLLFAYIFLFAFAVAIYFYLTIFQLIARIFGKNNKAYRWLDNKRNSILYFFHLKKKPNITVNFKEDNVTNDLSYKNSSSTTIELTKRKTIDESFGIDGKTVSFEQKSLKTDEKIAEEEPLYSPIVKTTNYANYKLPPFNTLDSCEANNSRKVNEETAKIKGQSLIDILNRFEYKSELLDIHISPIRTTFEICVDPNINIRNIFSLTDNIKMELAAREIKIDAPIPGRNSVGIEIPNVEKELVYLSELARRFPIDKKDSKLLFTLGKDSFGKPVFCELNKMPHMLIAGSTGSGKSVFINTIITSFLLRTKPDEVKLILIDPKKVEFTPHHDIPHLLMPVITDTSEAIFALKRMCVMMDERFSLFAEVGVRDIASYNAKVDENNKNPNNPKIDKLPYIVTIIDGYSELAMFNDDEILPSINRVTEYGRSVGMHFIISMQRPSYKLIDGVAKNNIPCRISFAMSSSIDSQTILGISGAEKLSGEGEMLFVSSGQEIPARLQGVYISDKEIEQVTYFCKSQGFIPQYDSAYFEFKNIGFHNKRSYSGQGYQPVDCDRDPLYEEAKQYVIEQQKASTSLIQRRFGVGVYRAGRIIDALENEGIIGPANGSRPREVYIKY